MKIAAVVVTFNRKVLLQRCLLAIANQTSAPDMVLVVDNASTDGTVDWLQHWLPEGLHQAKLLPLMANTGGAGGFSSGLQASIADGAEWIWMMDDDAEPHRDALAELICVAKDPNHIYGSLAIAGSEPAWETTLLAPPLGKVNQIQIIPDQAEVEMIPLLGMLVHRDLVAKIGVPDADFFISGDDAEYCLRARRAGSKIIIAGHSRIDHPKSSSSHINFLGKKITYLSLPPWKRYYDTRNRLLIAHRHHGLRLVTQTIPGTLLRFFTALKREPQKLAQAHAFLAGFVDGILKIKGKRHEKWGIRP